MRFKSPHSSTPGVVLEKSELKILYSARCISSAVIGVLGEVNGKALLTELVNAYAREHEAKVKAEAAKDGAKP